MQRPCAPVPSGYRLLQEGSADMWTPDNRFVLEVVGKPLYQYQRGLPVSSDIR